MLILDQPPASPNNTARVVRLTLRLHRASARAGDDDAACAAVAALRELWSLRGASVSGLFASARYTDFWHTSRTRESGAVRRHACLSLRGT